MIVVGAGQGPSQEDGTALDERLREAAGPHVPAVYAVWELSEERIDGWYLTFGEHGVYVHSDGNASGRLRVPSPMVQRACGYENLRLVRTGPRTMSDEARAYQDLQGWPVVAEGRSVWMVAGRVAEAIIVPAGRLDLDEFDGPVVEIPGDEPRWMLLTGTAGEYDDEIRGATVLSAGERIELPPTRTPDGELRWVRSPSCDRHPLPPFGAVHLSGV